jgi:hypothetical protein
MAVEKTPAQRDPEMADWYYNIPYYLKEYGTYALLVIALGLLGLQYYRYTQVKKDNALQEAWAKLNAADEPGTVNPPGQLSDVLDSATSPSIKAMAYLKTGLFYIHLLNAGAPAEGYQGVKLSAPEAIKAGTDALNTVVSDYPDQHLAVAVAHMGLGALAEARGDVATAKHEYGVVANAPAKSVGAMYASEAQYRLDHLDQWQTPIALIHDAVPATAPAFSGLSTFGPSALPMTMPAK